MFNPIEPEIDFSCRVCGVICPVAPDPPGRAVCEDHCPDHDYQYDKFRAWGEGEDLDDIPRLVD
jgi:hypothetical protein